MIFSPTLVDLIRTSEFVTKTKQTKRLAIDNTTFSSWNSCFTKGLYYGPLRKVNAKPRTPLIFGASLHLAMKEYLLGKSVDESIAVALADAAENNLDLACDPKRNSESLEMLFRSYIDHINIMPNERLVPLEVDGVKIVEKSFSVKLGTINDLAGEQIEVYWNGIIDLVGYYFNNLWVIDHKTTSIMGAKFADDKYRSSQMLGYYWVMLNLLKGTSITRQLKGVLINAFYTPKAGFEFKQFDLPLSPAKADEWQLETLANIQNLWQSLEQFLLFADSTTGATARCDRGQCVTKYGRCDYFDLCETPISMRANLLLNDAFFTTTNWNPGENE